MASKRVKTLIQSREPTKKSLKVDSQMGFSFIYICLNQSADCVTKCLYIVGYINLLYRIFLCSKECRENYNVRVDLDTYHHRIVVYTKAYTDRYNLLQCTRRLRCSDTDGYHTDCEVLKLLYTGVKTCILLYTFMIGLCALRRESTHFWLVREWVYNNCLWE